MLRQAVITLEFEVEDCLQEKVRENELRVLVDSVRANFKAVQLKVIERRPRRRARAGAPVRVFIPRSAPGPDLGEPRGLGD